MFSQVDSEEFNPFNAFFYFPLVSHQDPKISILQTLNSLISHFHPLKILWCISLVSKPKSTTMATRRGRNYRGHLIDSWRDQLLLRVAECMDSMDEQFQCLSTQTPTGGEPDPHGNREENGENSIAQDGSTSVQYSKQ